ncbi:MAG TPA: response regulator transcription factor [Rhodocyclaceae bacterium]|nr:response regulator transcription factor [Rhodocyclaceae bacterium]
MDSDSCYGIAADTIKVFLVDDHRVILLGLERLVESAAPRMQVVGMATHRAELMARIDAARPDVVVLDLDLGGESGLDCLPELVARSQAQVLVFTGSRDNALHQQAVLRGARGVVLKHEPAEVILSAIDKVHRGEVWLDRATIGRVMGILSRGRGADPESERLAQLTLKERQVLAVLVQEKGARNKVIADKLHMSEHTLRNHLTTIYSKLQVDGRLALYLYATTHEAMAAF